MEKINEKIGDRILRLMREQKYTQKELAGLVGVTEAAMSRYIKNEREPKLAVVANLATALDTTSDYLISGVRPQDDFAETYRLVARSATTMSESEKIRLIQALMKK